ncbi:MAG: ATP-binding protein [Bryobacteraceae bacterium]
MADTKALLIVSHDRSLVELLERELTPRHCHVRNTRELDEIRNHAFDAVLADVRGIEALRLVNGTCPQANVVLVDAAPFAADDLIAAFREGAYSAFSRPFVRSLLLDAVEQALARPRSPDELEMLSGIPPWVTFRMRCQFRVIDRMAQFAREIDGDLDADTRDHMATALRELLLNAVEHGGGSDPDKYVYVTRLRTHSWIAYYIRDPGPGFSLERLPHAAVSNPDDGAIEHLEIRQQLGMRPGGFGITLARNLLDGLYYNEKGNEVILVKNLNAPASRSS